MTHTCVGRMAQEADKDVLPETVAQDPHQGHEPDMARDIQADSDTYGSQPQGGALRFCLHLPSS